MTKKDFVKLAYYIRNSNEPFNEYQIARLADFCQDGNPKFKRERWLGYIAGTNGKNGGRKAEVVDATTVSPADFEVHNEGSIFLLQPLTPPAQEWIAEHLPENHTAFGSAVVVEHRYIADIVQGIRADGLEVL
jgi:hypothetical protein